jgi:adenylate cyclase
VSPGTHRVTASRRVSSAPLGTLSSDVIASRAGVDVGYVDDLIRLGILTRGEDDSFAPGAARTARVIRDLERSGLPLAGIADAVAGGFLSFSVFDSTSYDRVAPLTDRTFRDVAARTDVPLELLLVVREAIGFAIADPDEQMREDEMEVVPLIRSALNGGLPASSVERLLRVYGEAERRMVETESEAWVTHVLTPLLEAGVPTTDAIAEASKFGENHLGFLDQAMLAIHRGQQDHVWMTTTYEWVEDALERAGVRSRVERPPAMCFFDLAGYTRLTEEHGDQAAAEAARTLNTLVQRNAHEYRGRVVKWLGDGVMLYFAEPAGALEGSVEMVERVREAGLPSAHVGVDAGPVIIQDGDYFGGTVNVAARIASYARAGEVLASDQAVAAAGALPSGLRVEEIGAVELKGVSRLLVLKRVGREG